MRNWNRSKYLGTWVRVGLDWVGYIFGLVLDYFWSGPKFAHPYVLPCKKHKYLSVNECESITVNY
ncbi:hypothetical protein Hanom_Chr09g00837501 [Helianthus anomalus]